MCEAVGVVLNDVPELVDGFLRIFLGPALLNDVAELFLLKLLFLSAAIVVQRSAIWSKQAIKQI